MGIHNGTLLLDFFFLFKMFPQMDLTIYLANDFPFTKLLLFLPNYYAELIKFRVIIS